ncbi:MAG: YqaE/Pmp3 family membrane protein [Fimbriimonadaceae bacterium]|nr:YqaE/Pmp3 family membrane protein [Chitinophagales bacterium]
MAVLYILAIILPPLAVGLYTDWDTPTLWNLLFTLIGWLPGVVHAFIVITR